MMADFVTPRHSAVMERLRRRIELFRQHHNSCESRYEAAALERLELGRQQTLALHQRCLQAKAKRSNKHRQPPAGAGEQAGHRAPGGGGGSGAAGAEPGGDGGGGGGGVVAEQSRNSTLIALQETVKRKLESAGSPAGRDQVNGFSDGFPPSKKACLDGAKANGSPMDSKLGLGDTLASNGTHGPGGGELAADGVKDSAAAAAAADFHRKEMKQEPDDILPIMPPSSGGNNNNNLFPDLNLDEHEWTELMEELNRTVAYEDIQDILNDGFEERKDPLEMAAPNAQPAQGLLPLDLASVKAEFSPSAFEQDPRTGSPHVRSASSSHPAGSPAAASSPAAPPPRPPPGHLLAKDLSPAQQLQQLAAQQQRAQHLHSQLQHKAGPTAPAKFHAHPPPWTQMAAPSQSPLADKPAGPSLYPQDFNPAAQKQRLMSGQPPKGSPKAATGGYVPGPVAVGHPAQGPPLAHPPAAVLSYSNTKPLSHFEAGPAPPRPPNGPGQHQNKAALLSLLRQQQQQMKQKNSINFRQHLPHSQPEPSSYPAAPHGAGPAGALASAPPGPNAMAANHGNAAYLGSQAAAVLKQQQQQQQILEQQKQQYLQRQQMMAEQEKQRQQDQQLQRHLTRPPPQYQDQPGQAANQNAFPQPPVGQFAASSASSMGGPAPSGQRMFPPPQGMMGLNMASGAVPVSGAAPPPAGQADLGLASCGGGAGADMQQALYNNMSLHPGQQRQPMYRHNPLAQQQQQQQQQQHLSKQPAAASAMLKQQQMAATRANVQNAVWQQAPATAFANAFHMQQQQQQASPRVPKMASAVFNGRPVAGMMQGGQQRAPPNPQGLGPSQTQQQAANQNILPDMAAFGAAGGGRQGLACNQGYQVGRTANQQQQQQQQQQQLSFGYNAAAGSFAAESDLVESLLKGQSALEWMADLDELLASHQ